MGAAGTDPEWARYMPERLGELGLVDVDVDAEVEVEEQLFRGGSDAARFWNLTLHQARDRVIAFGVPGEVVDAGRAVLADRNRWFPVTRRSSLGPAAGGGRSRGLNHRDGVIRRCSATPLEKRTSVSEVAPLLGVAAASSAWPT